MNKKQRKHEFNLSALTSRGDRLSDYVPPKIPAYTFRGQGSQPPSKGDGIGNGVKIHSQMYTGDAMLGIAQMSKSNAVPVFSQQEIIDIGHMRR